VTCGAELNQRYQSPKDAIRKTWNMLLRLRKKRVHVPESRGEG
jgi:hypothetical protein